MKEIIVTTQEEMDALPDSFAEYTRIIIKADPSIRIIVRKARDNSSAELWERSSAELWDNSSAELWGNSSAVLWGNSSAVLWGNSSAALRERSSAELWGNSSAALWERSSAVLRERSSAELWGNSSAALRERSSAELWDNSSAVLWGNSSAVLWGNSSAVLRGNSSAVLWERSSAHCQSSCAKVKAGDNATIYEHAAPEILEVESTVNVVKKSTFINPSFETWLERGWVVADGIRQKLVSKKTQGEVTIYKTQDFKKEQFFVAQKGDKFAHAKTVEDAIKDLRYKISDRDMSDFKGWKLSDIKPIEDLIEAYRVITGACSEGTKMFCEGRELKDEYTIKEAIELTKDSYGGNQFAKFFEVAND